MATKEAVFNVKVNTGNSVKEVQDLDKSLDNLNRATDETAKSTRDVNATFEEVYGELQPLSTRLGEAEDRLYELALAGQQSSDEFRELLDVVSEYRRTQIAVDATVDASASTLTTKLVAGVELGAGAFQAYESAVALAGVESEALVQTMVKLQAIQGLVGSIQSMQLALKESAIGMKLAAVATKIYNAVVGKSTGLMKVFRIALLSTGIGLLVAGIGLLIANFDKVIKFFKPVIDGFKAIGDAIGLTNFAEQEQEAERERRHQLELARIEREKKAREDAFNARQKQFDREIALLEAQGKASTELRAQQLQDQIETNKQNAILLDKDLEKYKKYTTRKAEDLDASIAKAVEAGQQQYAELLAQQNAYNEASADAENQLKILRINTQNDINQKNKEAFDKRKQQQAELFKIEQERLWNIQALENEFLDELEKLDEEHYQRTLTAQEKEENAVNEKYFRLIETAKQYGMDTTDLETKQQIELMDIRKKYDEEALKLAKEREEKIADLRENFNAIFRDEFDQRIADARKANEEELKVLEEANKEKVISDGEFYLAKLKLANDLADKEKQIEKEKNEFIKQQNIKAREEQLKGITKVIEGAQKGLEGLSQINALANEIDQARLNTIANNRDENLENLDRNLQAQLNNENLTAEQKAQIEENFAQQKFVIQQKAFEEEDKIKRAQFNRDKALKLAQVSIDTASAIVKAIAQFGPPPSPLGIAGIASAGVIGLTQALAILNQQYQGGSAPSPPQVGGGASAGSLTGAGASTFTANTQAEQTDLSTIGQDVPVSQVVVLESDITGTQSKVAVQEAKSSF